MRWRVFQADERENAGVLSATSMAWWEDGKRALSGSTGKQVGGEAGDPTDRRWWTGLGLASCWEECRSHSKRNGKLLR